MELNLTYKVTEEADFEVLNNNKFIGKIIRHGKYWEFHPDIKKDRNYFYIEFTLSDESIHKAKELLFIRLSKIVELYNIL